MSLTTRCTLSHRSRPAQSPKGCVLLTNERVVWTAADPHVVFQEHGALGIPLHCVADAKEAGGGWFGGGWASPFKITFAVHPLYANAQPPVDFTLSFHGGREDRDTVFRELTRVLRDKPWQAAPPVADPVVLAAADPVAVPGGPAAPPHFEPTSALPPPPPVDQDTDGIFVILPHSSNGLGGQIAAEAAAAAAGTSQPSACPPRCGFDYDFSLEHAAIASR
jgi:hypothetical protein